MWKGEGFDPVTIDWQYLFWFCKSIDTAIGINSITLFFTFFGKIFLGDMSHCLLCTIFPPKTSLLNTFRKPPHQPDYWHCKYKRNNLLFLFYCICYFAFWFSVIVLVLIVHYVYWAWVSKLVLSQLYWICLFPQWNCLEIGIQHYQFTWPYVGCWDGDCHFCGRT